MLHIMNDIVGIKYKKIIQSEETHRQISTSTQPAEIAYIRLSLANIYKIRFLIFLFIGLKTVALISVSEVYLRLTRF